MKRPQSITPTTCRIRSSSRAGSVMRSNLQSRMRLPLSVTKGRSGADWRGCTLAPSHLERRPGCFQSESDHFDRHRRVGAELIHQFGRIDDDDELSRSGSDDLFMQQRSAASLDQIERAALHFVGAIDREIDLAMLAERRQRNTRGACQVCDPLRGGNADKAQPLSPQAGKRLDSEGRGRAAAEPDDHVVFDKLDRRFRGGALMQIAIVQGVTTVPCSCPGRRRSGAGANSRNGRGVVRSAENRRARNYGGGSRGGRLARGDWVLAAVRFDDWL